MREDRGHLLLVEDEPIIAMAGAARLRKLGWTAVVADSGERAVELALSDPRLVLVLMDIDLGRGIDGPEAARRILESRRMPVVFLTSHAEREYVEKVRSITRYGYVTKESNDFVLDSSIEMALQLFGAEEELRSDAERFAAIVGGTLDGYLLVDREARILEANAEYAAMSGYSAAELAGMDLGSLEEPPGPGEPAGIPDRLARIAAEGRGRFEARHRARDGAILDVEIAATWWRERGLFLLFVRDITDRARAEREREATVALLLALTRDSSPGELLAELTLLMRRWSGCSATGVRLAAGEDFPYVETRGFPPEFIAAERFLCERSPAGAPLRDESGSPVLACMCGNVIRGRFDPALPFFTEGGSFWTNSTTELLASTGEAERQARTRNRCNGEGYESVALVPIRHGERRLGLLQFNDPRKGRFARADILLFERLAGYLGLGLVQRETAGELRESEARARGLLAEKELVLRELHHRVKNSLNGVRGLLAMQAEALAASDPSSARPLEDAAGRVETMVVLYDRLSRSGDRDSMTLAEFLPALVESTLGATAAGGAIRTELELAELRMSAKRLSLLGIVVNELVTNAAKHAFAGRRDGLLRVRARLRGEELELEVADDGRGLPPGTRLEDSRGFGLRLVDLLARQLGGEAIVGPGPGASITLRIPAQAAG